MPLPKLTCFLRFRFLALMLSTSCAALALAADAAPRKPVDDAEVLERLPSRSGDVAARELVALRAAMAAAARIRRPRRGSPSAISIWRWRVATRAMWVMPRR